MSTPPKTIADLIEDRFGLPTTAGRARPAGGTVAQLLTHRTHRRYRADPVPDEVLEIVLAAALSSPAKSDLQQVAVIVLRDREKQATVGGWIPDMPFIAARRSSWCSAVTTAGSGGASRCAGAPSSTTPSTCS